MKMLKRMFLFFTGLGFLLAVVIINPSREKLIESINEICDKNVK